MGMFKQKVKVSNPADSDKFFEAEFWIDTGALYSFIPKDYLDKIGFQPINTKNFFYADGRTDKKLFGFVNFEIDGFDGKITCPVIEGPENSLFLFGATALENFGVEADPINKKLNPIFAIIGGFIASS